MSISRYIAIAVMRCARASIVSRCGHLRRGGAKVVTGSAYPLITWPYGGFIASPVPSVGSPGGCGGTDHGATTTMRHTVRFRSAAAAGVAECEGMVAHFNRPAPVGFGRGSRARTH